MDIIPHEIIQLALATATQAALEAGDILKECYAMRYERDERVALSGTHEDDVVLGVSEKTEATDLVTEYDKRCDLLITNKLRAFNESDAAKDCGFAMITEELAPEGPLTNAPTWIVDPIDGTMAFVHKSFDCCISIGLAVKKRPVLGVVYCPFLGNNGGELYTAVEGEGAFMNGKRIHVSKCRKAEKAVVLFNMPWRMASPAIDSSLGIRTEMANDHVRAIRSYGAAVLQLAQVAAGRADLYMEPGGKMWDVCAGAVLVQEAGGCVCNLDGSPFTLETHNITCGSTPEIVEYGAHLCKTHDLLNQYYKD